MENEGERDLGIVFTTSPTSGEAGARMLEVASDAIAAGKSVGIFMVGDGVLLARNSGTEFHRQMQGLIGDGLRAWASADHMKAFGIGSSQLIEGVQEVPKTYKQLTNLVMEEWAKVVVY